MKRNETEDDRGVHLEQPEIEVIAGIMHDEKGEDVEVELG